MHISSDFPDPLSPNKTPAVANLVDGAHCGCTSGSALDYLRLEADHGTLSGGSGCSNRATVGTHRRVLFPSARVAALITPNLKVFAPAAAMAVGGDGGGRHGPVTLGRDDRSNTPEPHRFTGIIRIGRKGCACGRHRATVLDILTERATAVSTPTSTPM